MNKKKVVIIGAGGHAKVIVDILQQNEEYEIVGLVDVKGTEGFWGIPYVGDDNDLPIIKKDYGVKYAFAAIGNSKVRERVTKHALESGYEMINVISKDSIISQYAHLGIGIVVMPGAIINAEAEIGDGCIINTNASVDHEVKIGMYSHVAPGGAISGKTIIGNHCFLGTGSRVIDGISIGNNTIIGAGATVVKDIESSVVAVGVPARVIKKK